MKIRLRLALVGLAISFALPTFAQEQNTVDPEVRQQIEAISMTNVDAHNKHEAAAVVSLYVSEVFGRTSCRVLRRQETQFSGRVGTGFSDKLLRDLFSELNKIRAEDCPFLTSRLLVGAAGTKG